MTEATTLPSDQDLIAFIRQMGRVTAWFAAKNFDADRAQIGAQLRRLKAEGKLKNESVKAWVSETYSWRYTTDWSVA